MNTRKHLRTQGISSSPPSPVSKTNNPPKTQSQPPQNTDSTKSSAQGQGDKSPPQGTVRTLWDGLKKEPGRKLT